MLKPKSGIETRIKTLNKMGYTSKKLSKFAQTFVDRLRPGSEFEILEIGSALGFFAEKLLEKGCHVTAVDLNKEHLNLFKERLPSSLSPNLSIKCAHFPRDLTFPPNSLHYVIGFQVLHYLSGSEVEEGLKKIYEWLKPQGKLYLTVGTPYTKIIERFIPVFEDRKANGESWPGYFKIEDYCDDPECIETNPPYINFMDQDIIKRALTDAGFVIEKLEEFSRATDSSQTNLNERECVGAIAIKP